MLHSLSTLAFSPSGPEALWTFSPSNSLATPFRSNVMSPMEENGQAPFEGGSESSSHVKADWTCLLQMLAFCLESVLYVFFCLVFAVPLCASVYMCLVVTCWGRARLLALVRGV